MDTQESVLSKTDNAYIAQKEAARKKHRKAQRGFPAMEDINPGDRFSIRKGTTVFSKTLNMNVILPEDIKIEIIGINQEELPVDVTFQANKLIFCVETWIGDERFGELDTVDYTDLSLWHCENK